MAIIMKTFHFVVYILVIYSCLEDKVANVGAQDDPSLEGNINSFGRQERDILILNEEISDVSSSRENLKGEMERKDSLGKAEFHTIDDEDGEIDENEDLGSGKRDMNIQGDEPASPSDGGDQENIDPELNNSSIRAPAKTLTVSSTTVVVTTSSWTTSKMITATKSINLGNTTSSVASTATPLLLIPHATTGVQNTIDASALSSAHLSSLGTSIISTRAARASTVMVISPSSLGPTAPTAKQPTTVKTATKQGSDVENQKDPSPKQKEKKTLFGFVTIEILVALLAGAACAVILVIFLVYRLKKRNEGSYELQETLMLKSGGYAEEKEVFV